MFGLNHVIFRPHNVYGEFQNIGDRYRNVIGIFLNQIMQGQPMTIFGDGRQTRAFSFIDDVAPVIAASVTRPKSYNQIFNVGADQPYSVNELANVVAKAMGIKPHIKHLDARNEVVHAYSAHEKVRETFRRPDQKCPPGRRGRPHGGVGKESRRPPGQAVCGHRSPQKPSAVMGSA